MESTSARRKSAALPAPLTSEEACQQAQAEGLTLRVANNGTGYSCVYQADPVPGRLGGFSNRKPYTAQVRRRGKDMYLGIFATAEEAALCVARSLEGQAAAQRAAATGDDDGGDDTGEESEEARRQAQAEGLTLRVANNKTGYFGVSLNKPGQPKPYKTLLVGENKTGYLGVRHEPKSKRNPYRALC